MSVEQPRIGVDVHRQVDLAVPQRRLSRAWSNAPFAQQRPERVPQGVNVDGSPAFVPLGDASRQQVPVEDANESLRDGEQRSLAVTSALVVA